MAQSNPAAILSTSTPFHATQNGRFELYWMPGGMANGQCGGGWRRRGVRPRPGL